ncbi:MAG: hypothetical protein ACTSO9_17400, partial [Candidatus Helarchaeota archaeon]
MSELKVKKLIGSMKYGIKLEILEAVETLEEIYAKVEFYHMRRMIKEGTADGFQDLVDLISQFWEEDAQMPIFPRKISACLSEYFEELNYPQFNFELSLNAILHRQEERKQLDVLTKIIEVGDEDIKPKMEKIELELPETGKIEFLVEKIDDYLEEVPKTMKSSIYYVDADGNTKVISTEQEIIQSEDDAREFTSSTTFENPLDIPLKDVRVNNIVPYAYKINNINSIGFEDVEPLKRKLGGGLQLTWIIPEVQPRQTVKTELTLERRISRTMLMNIEDEVNVVQTYFNIEAKENRFSASERFTNIQNEIIDNLVFEDEIPNTYNLIDVEPNDPFDLNVEKEGFDQLIKWQ